MVPLGDLEKGFKSFTCTNGHSTTIVIESPKFSILFELGVLAWSAGFYRESVANMASSLERLYEFYIFYITSEKGIALDQFQKVWKLMSNQSERQLGAFLALYLLDNNDKPPLISNNLISFRNKVIHKGYIPTMEEALKYGGAVTLAIGNILNSIGDIDTAFKSWNSYEMSKIKEQLAKKHTLQPTNLNTIIQQALELKLPLNEAFFEKICRDTQKDPNWLG